MTDQPTPPTSSLEEARASSATHSAGERRELTDHEMAAWERLRELDAIQDECFDLEPAEYESSRSVAYARVIEAFNRLGGRAAVSERVDSVVAAARAEVIREVEALAEDALTLSIMLAAPKSARTEGYEDIRDLRAHAATLARRLRALSQGGEGKA